MIIAAAVSVTAAFCDPVLAARPTQVVLGSKTYWNGYPVVGHWDGWGTARPAVISNGGDPGGVLFNLHWHNWGQAVATAYGQTSIYDGGWRWGAWVQLRAAVIGRCANSASRAYLHLQLRLPRRMRGPLGPWFEWGGGRPFSHTSTCGVGRHS